ncbi:MULTISPECIES: hypothetical protein [Bacillus cereus group]|uniref:Uncharacterized protein n=2 Tax=Bacillus cereus group TaxID=86661 RepID=A0A9X5ZED4_BACCE|nr:MULTISPECIES: hypothetical protein [Bacillus cereus group]MDV8116093.1 hypothetical protein [Bacillus sp. BAU-SS-2023]AQQ66178.1 hypothetical Protein FORC21_5383 [Bacillus cereus]MBX9160027.1 hypothetical protein [Bacillus cereus]MCP1143090.1 hypothetical protein [Bacillus cereus]MDF9574073.1 hypothetical protein [Bacillus cereus]
MTVKTDDVVIEGLKDWKQDILHLQNEGEEDLAELKNEMKILLAKRRCLQSAKSVVEGNKGALKNKIFDMATQLEEERKQLDKDINQLETLINTLKEANKVILSEIEKSLGILTK